MTDDPIHDTTQDLPQSTGNCELSIEDEAKNRQRVLAFVRDLQSKHLERLGRWFSESSRIWVPPLNPVVGKKRILALFRAIFRRYTELNWEVQRIYSINGGTVIFASKSWGILRADETYRNSILTLIQFGRTGKIEYLSDYVKDTKAFS